MYAPLTVERDIPLPIYSCTYSKKDSYDLRTTQPETVESISLGKHRLNTLKSSGLRGIPELLITSEMLIADVLFAKRCEEWSKLFDII